MVFFSKQPPRWLHFLYIQFDLRRLMQCFCLQHFHSYFHCYDGAEMLFIFNSIYRQSKKNVYSTNFEQRELPQKPVARVFFPFDICIKQYNEFSSILALKRSLVCSRRIKRIWHILFETYEWAFEVRVST